MAKNFSDLENVTTENAKGVKDILNLAIKENKAFALAVEENDGIKLVFAGNPAFAVRAATTLLIKVVTPAARGEVGTEADQLETLAEMARASERFDKLVPRCDEEADGVEITEKCEEAPQKSMEKCENAEGKRTVFDEIKEFARLYNQLPNRKPLVVVPSSYSYVTEEELIENDINVVIYANQMLRAAYPAMVKVAQSILQHHRAKEASEQYCMSIREIINLIPGGKVIERR